MKVDDKINETQNGLTVVIYSNSFFKSYYGSISDSFEAGNNHDYVHVLCLVLT